MAVCGFEGSFIKNAAIIIAETGEERQIVRTDKDIYAIDLQEVQIS